ncbi:hypothetical protein Dform_00523 [Dehalogenimonas formicexedens]|uniref:Uncharacterized protein n=1 Tax=Dehalogenimonas formicexedens TaxID=1839801 RepID=A0A1P8F613_9CHLR|nr:hypothetical protein [Dehalogenimonas formicexedens]APV43878.1 hypothetical protein Dform_00523 [Dehalogenimonas formicexedens]
MPDVTTDSASYVLTHVKDFIVPVLKILDLLGGVAELGEIENKFYEKFHANLDPSKEWLKITPNHHKELWRDYCGTRVAYRFLRPLGYITTIPGGIYGSIYQLTPKGRELLKE